MNTRMTFLTFRNSAAITFLEFNPVFGNIVKQERFVLLWLKHTP